MPPDTTGVSWCGELNDRSEKYFPCQVALIMNFRYGFVFYETSGLTHLKLFFGKLFFTFALLSTSSLFQIEKKIVDSTNLRFYPEIFRFV